jgi:hypothetical protein
MNLKSLLKTLGEHLNQEVPAAPLISFRLIFGALMIFSTLRFIYLGWIEDHYINPTVHFKYWGFEWVEPLSCNFLYAIHYLMIVAALGIMFLHGVAYRVAAVVLFITFTYTELIDITYYLNHYYFVSLICFLLIFMPDQLSPFAEIKKQYIPRKTIWLIKMQIAILYVYAGLAKINYDWLIEALPLKIWVPANDKIPLIGSLFTWEFTPYLFSWIGMLYDTFIVFFLMWKPTRIMAYITVIIFHSLTGIMFQIGVFPLVMIGIATIFFSDEWHSKFIRIFTLGKQLANFKLSKNNIRPWWNYVFGIYLIFQLLFPWRYLLYPGNLFWTEEGYRFSWRVMLMEKAGTATFYVKDTKTGREGIVVNSEFLNAHQEKQMSMQPDLILQFAHFLGRHYALKGVHEPEVRAEVYVTLNAQPSRLIIDPQVNLLNERDTFKAKDWIIHYNN